MGKGQLYFTEKFQSTNVEKMREIVIIVAGKIQGKMLKISGSKFEEKQNLHYIICSPQNRY